MTARFGKRALRISRAFGGLFEHLAEDVLEDAAVPVVGDFFGSVHADEGCEGFRFAIGEILAWTVTSLRGVSVATPSISKISWPVRPSDSRVFAGFEFQRKNAHAHQVAAVNAFVAFSNHGAHAEQTSAFRGPVARGAGTIFFAGDDHQRHAFFAVFHGGS